MSNFWRCIISCDINHKAVLKLMKSLGLKGKERQISFLQKRGRKIATVSFRSGLAAPTYGISAASERTQYLQSMSRKWIVWRNSFSRLKSEMFYGEKFEGVNAFITELIRR